MNTGSHTAMESLPIMRRWTRSLGITAWASPPPAPSWRVYLLVSSLGYVGLIMIAFDLGWIRF